MTKKRLNKLRDNIDSIDRRIVRLLNNRASAAMQIGKIKTKSRAETFVPAREKTILRNIVRMNHGALPSSALIAIYREIMSASLSLEKMIRVAYMGPPASFSHQATLKRFGKSVSHLACRTIDDVFESLQRKEADYGVVPVENSSEGTIASTLDQLAETEIKICAEIYQPIAHYLLAKGPRSAIKRVITNPSVFGQCRKWLRSELPQAELVTAESTTRAAEMASKDKHVAAIAGRLAADVYHLNILNADIQDVYGNMTRFLVIGNSFGNRTGDDKTSMLFAVKHQAGSLHRALGSLKKYKLNMTKIESRPSRQKAWEYLFFVDIEGHVQDKNVCGAMRDLNKHCLLLTVLGSYPKAIDS
ncbi:prephenate dehydratase [Verrucomicrobiota bacterium]